ncbi:MULTISPECIES: hypothetical protein [unclassified Pseudomonas]|uniref:hypothetical protein n=1 Tax=unclassified Pseudomonas TaxID=196821 RepID=UPI0011A53268|nr:MULTISPECIES: hypothetical protein [unclassified Pseudomonas]TWC11958.1 hypothetical protein FBY00_12870 [Pseudomonas sp. SJZ075]TWC28511.1 hypothetical protein FBY02_1292 [Pseudomonas sp. SJZ078]TWC48545.1 hypothetical protein FBY11_12870 [Pseudomonas sp. SJZ124]TWC84230.1 hypothetical protein FBY09_12870 [Pseudomonas sp. SJZ101]
MLSRILDARLRFVDHDSKFVLLAFWRCYGAATPQRCSVKQLAEDLRLPAQAVSKSLAQLVKVEVLTVSTQPEGKGRPKCIFEVSEGAQSQLREIKERRLRHPELLERLLRGERIRATWSGWKEGLDSTSASNPDSREEKRGAPVRMGKLSLANRLLLMILVGHADPFGVVRGVSSRELCFMAGIEVDCLKQRLRRLTALGFIRRHIPGIASSIFAKKLTSIYLLNLNHLQLSPVRDVVSTAVHQVLDDSNRDCEHVTAVWRDRESFLKRREYHIPLSVVRLFRKAPKHAFDQLEFFICESASGFLSRHWAGADSAVWKKVRGVDAVVKQQIADFFRMPMLDPKHKVALDHDELIDFFERLVFRVANEYARRFSELSAVSFTEVDFMLLPVHVSIGHEHVAMLFKGRPDRDQEHWLVTRAYGDPEVTRVSRESDIELDVRQKAGLLTPL